MTSPTQEYRRRLQERESRAADHEKTHIRLGNIRLLLLVTAMLTAWGAFRAHALSPWWSGLILAAFVSVATYHARVLRSRDLARRAVAFYQQGLARLEDR